MPIEKFRSALEAEIGIGVDSSYEPLNKCSLYVPHTKPARYKLNEKYWAEIDPTRFSLPVCDKIYKEESVCIHHKVLMGTKADMDIVASAIKKIYDKAKTPYQRVLKCDQIDKKTKEQLKEQYKQLNPAALRINSPLSMSAEF